jgi:nitric oxide reductase NorE protein
MTNAEQTASALGRVAVAESGYRTRHLPSDKDMWVFVLGDLIIFGSYFLIFMVYRHQHHALFLASQRQLNLTVGVVNTLLLLTSSWFIARGVQATRVRDYDRAVRLTVSGGVCGVLFLLLKIYEWSTKLAAGLTFPHNEFFMFYYLLTGVHVFHVALGLVFLGVVFVNLRNPENRRISTVETGATYWHMVDLLWVVIFALVYVMR